jgi:hypothetical protein
MRSAVVLAVATLCLAPAATARAGWTVNATGECIPAWIAPQAAQGPVAMLNALPLPFRQAVGGGQVAASGTQAKGGAAVRVLSWPALVVGGLGVGVIEMPIWLVAGLADTVTLGSLDLVPDDAKALTLASVRPRFLGSTGTTPESCGQPAAPR